jgi:ribonuclease HI
MKGKAMIEVYFDGSCEPNPGGLVQYGVVVFDNSHLSKEIAKRANVQESKRTNNVAEYCGCIAAMKYLLHQKLEREEIIMRGDSKLVIHQMDGTWQIKEGAYVEYAKFARNLLPFFTNIKFEWVPRDRNTIADGLARWVK